jgi:hypothetical protein
MIGRQLFAMTQFSRRLAPPVARLAYVPLARSIHLASNQLPKGPMPTKRQSLLPLIRPYSTTSTEPNPTPPKGIYGRLKAFLQQYGKLGFGVYVSISLVTFSSIYLALRTGVDVKGLVRKVGLPDSNIWDSAGTVAVSYAIYKLLMPARIFLTIALTTFISKRTRFGLPRGTGESKR